jgi:hypothetical protein
MKEVEPSPVRGVTVCHRERDDDQGGEGEEPRYRESQEQEACPFSLMDSCHGHRPAGEDGEKVRTWEPGKDERKAGNGRATAEKKGEKKRKMEKRERNKVVDTVDGSMGMIDRASTMASSTRRATAKSCPTLIVKALGHSVLVYLYLRIFVRK